MPLMIWAVMWSLRMAALIPPSQGDRVGRIATDPR
jgi:hypothetical protein